MLIPVCKVCLGGYRLTGKEKKPPTWRSGAFQTWTRLQERHAPNRNAGVMIIMEMVDAAVFICGVFLDVVMNKGECLVKPDLAVLLPY